MKLGCHDNGGGAQVLADPYQNPLDVAWEETKATWRFCAAGLSGLYPAPVHVQACMTTFTPDQHFVVGLANVNPHLVVLAGFSGHGAKHGAAVGEAAADLVLGGASRVDLAGFAPERFEAQPRPPG